MKNKFLTLYLFLIVNIISAQTLVLCDKAEGATYLRQDKWDGYYDRVNTLEISIQLKNDSLDLTDRESALKKYRNSYEQEVLSMNVDESEKLSILFKELFTKINKLNTKLLPDTIRLIIVKGDHYGQSTFFTRGNAIITSRASLANMAPINFKNVMYHELSHIISRYQPKLREELYNHLGFIKTAEPIMILSDFYRSILFNPDGVQMDYAIPLLMADSTELLFVPLIYTKAKHFNPKTQAFFGYLNFQLMPIDKMGDVYFMRDIKDVEQLDMGHIMKKYFEQITMNTQYIIHPDEILADNFMYLFRSPEENAKLDSNLLAVLHKSFSTFQNQ